MHYQYTNRLYNLFLVMLVVFSTIDQSDKDDLQLIQLRTCHNVKRRDRVSINNLHTGAKLLILDQR